MHQISFDGFLAQCLECLKAMQTLYQHKPAPVCTQSDRGLLAVRPVIRADGSPAMVETEDGKLAPVFKFDAANALKAAALLGKHLSMFTDKVDHTSSDGTMPVPSRQGSHKRFPNSCCRTAIG